MTIYADSFNDYEYTEGKAYYKNYVEARLAAIIDREDFYYALTKYSFYDNKDVSITDSLDYYVYDF